MSSDIKVGTIVNIMKVNNEYVQRIELLERKRTYYKNIGDKTNLLLTDIELRKEKSKYGEFLDYYI